MNSVCTQSIIPLLLLNYICCSRVELTAHVETGPGEDVSVRSVAHQVVSRLLPGAAQVAEGDADGAGTEDAVGAAGHPRPVQRPEQRASVEVHPRAQGAGRCERGAHQQHGVLRGDHRSV